MTPTTSPLVPPLLRVLELASAMRCSRTYVWAMRRSGFIMPGGRATVAEARQWLRDHPGFRANRPIVNLREHS